MPQNTKFKSKRCENFLKLIESGVPIGIARHEIGLDDITYYLWKERAGRYNPEDEETRADKPYYLFFRRIDQAHAAAFQQLIEEINRTGMDFQAAAPVAEGNSKAEKIMNPPKGSRSAQSLRRFRALTFLGERLFPSYFGNRTGIENEEINEKLFKELQQLAARERRNIAPSAESREPEDWELLPGELDDSD
jgi:hypothetical protein